MLTAKARQWGNSIGFTISKEVAQKEQIRPNDDVEFEIKKKLKLPDPSFFGCAKDSKIDAQKLKDQLREESDW